MRKQHAVNERRQSNQNNRGRTTRGDRHGPPHGGRRPHAKRHDDAADGTIPAAFVSPFQASQPQSGHNSATVVRTGVSGPSQQQTLFYSSVQRRGGVFTRTPQETTAQLARTGVLPNSTAHRRRARAAMEEATGRPKTLHDRFDDMQTTKRQKELHEAKALVASKRGENRFVMDDSDSETA